MEPLNIVRYVWAAHRQSMRSKGITLEGLMAAFNYSKSKATAHRIMQGPQTKHDQAINVLLSCPERKAALEAELGLPGLFRLPDRAAIDALARGEVDDIDEAGGLEVHYGSSQRSPFDLIGPERDTLRTLASIIRNPAPVHVRGALLPWTAPFGSGAAFLSRNLIFSEGLGDRIGALYLLRPGPPDRPYESALGHLLDSVGINAVHPDWPRRLIDHIRETRSIIVLANADYLTPETRTRSLKINMLIDAAVAAPSGSRHRPAILSLGPASDPRLKPPGADRLAHRLNDQLVVPGPDRYVVFRRFVDRYMLQRNTTVAALGGSRLKRARWRYQGDMDRDIYPINIRLRAFFASNPDNVACFDPTAGFDALAGDCPLPEEVRSYKNDLERFLDRLDLSRNLTRAKNPIELYILRLLSCATHWITEDGLALLCEGHSGHLAVKVGQENLERTLKQLDGAVREVEIKASRPDIPPERAFIVSLTLKALVQDQWRRASDLERARRCLMHWRIAKKLYQDRDEKEKLEREFPYEPHWGRTRMFFLAECIRHLVRASEDVEPFASLADFTTPRSEFPDKPAYERDRIGCDPHQVWSFCFSHLYWRELNANRYSSPTRALAKRYGAYQMALELLQVLSSERKTGQPHWALAIQQRRAFRQEAAFALLDVGKAEQAEAIFAELDQDEGSHASVKLRLSAKLNRALARTVTGHDREAAALVKEAEDILSRTSNKAISTRSREALKRRLRGRRAQLRLAAGDLSSAAALYSELDTESPLGGEMALCYIQTLNEQADAAPREDAKRLLEQAYRIATTNRSDALRDAMHHEALGFRVAEAAVLRRLTGSPAIADAILDDVCQDMLKYGCAERAYLAFLLEAGRTLNTLGQVRRAYASYLRPCIERASARGQFHEARAAAVEAESALAALLEENGDRSPARWLEDHKLALEAERTKRPLDEPDHRMRSQLDPLYGYEAELSTGLLHRMADRSFIEQERMRLQRVIDAADGSRLQCPWTGHGGAK